MPKPPADFVLDDQGRCIAAAFTDNANNRPLECIIRRMFSRTHDHKCLLLCPVDMPVQVLKSTNFSGWIAVDDDQIKQIIPLIHRACCSIHDPHASRPIPFPADSAAIDPMDAAHVGRCKRKLRPHIPFVVSQGAG